MSTVNQAVISEQQTTKRIRVVLADDHALVRAGIRALLERIDGVEVVAEAGDGKNALQAISTLLPDVVLLDISMPELTGLEVLRYIAKFPSVQVIILSVYEAAEYAAQALRSGAAGFLPKSAASNELELALRTVMRGDRYVSREFSSVELNAPSATTRVSWLTPRQIEVLRMIAMGQSTKDIARALSISVKTVETHRSLLMDRLGIYDVAGLVRYAIKTGLTPID